MKTKTLLIASTAVTWLCSQPYASCQGVTDTEIKMIERDYAHIEGVGHEKAVADYTAFLNRSVGSNAQIGKVLYYRGVAFSELEQPAKAIADYSRVAALEGVPAPTLAKALVNRALLLEPNTPDKAIADYTRVIAMPDAPVTQLFKALMYRGNILLRSDEAKATADFARLEKMEGVPEDLLGLPYYFRAIHEAKHDRIDSAVALYARAIDSAGLESNVLADSLLRRAGAYMRSGMIGHPNATVLSDPNRIALILTDLTRVIEMKEILPASRAKALNARGTVLHDHGRINEAMKDYTGVLEIKGAPTKEVANSLLSRGSGYQDSKDWDMAIKDWTAVIGLRDVEPEDQRQAYFNRGCALDKVKLSRLDALKDYGNAIAIKGPPSICRAGSLINRADILSNQGMFEEARKDAADALSEIDKIPKQRLAPSELEVLQNYTATAKRTLQKLAVE